MTSVKQKFLFFIIGCAFFNAAHAFSVQDLKKDIVELGVVLAVAATAAGVIKALNTDLNALQQFATFAASMRQKLYDELKKRGIYKRFASLIAQDKTKSA